MLDIISFLTRIPVRGGIRIEEVADKSHFFPLVALLIGALVSVIAFTCFTFLAGDIASLLTLLSIYFITGLLHLDGLADFFDGIMASGSRMEKISAMKDEKIGISGLFSTILVLILNFSSIKIICAGATFYDIVCAMVIAEVSAKISMNTCIFLGKGVNEGMGAVLIKRCTNFKYTFALISSVVISSFACIRFFIVITGIIVAIFVSYVAKNNFGDVSGDVMGACNELARCTTLLIWAICQAAF
jgi:adenosylcobinamide-GDP ribazoletransferase